jgi:hypothetical protein
MRISLTYWLGIVGVLLLVSCSSEQIPSKAEPKYTDTQSPKQKLLYSRAKLSQNMNIKTCDLFLLHQ